MEKTQTLFGHVWHSFFPAHVSLGALGSACMTSDQSPASAASRLPAPPRKVIIKAGPLLLSLCQVPFLSLLQVPVPFSQRCPVTLAEMRSHKSQSSLEFRKGTNLHMLDLCLRERQSRRIGHALIPRHPWCLSPRHASRLFPVGT